MMYALHRGGRERIRASKDKPGVCPGCRSRPTPHLIFDRVDTAVEWIRRAT